MKNIGEQTQPKKYLRTVKILESRPSQKYLRTEKILQSRPSQKLFENSQNYWIEDTAKDSLRTVQNIGEPTSSSEGKK